MSNGYLVHHGILGQRWGKKNGPPYPLNASDKSYAEREAGHNIKAKDVKKNMDYLSDKELQQALNRISMQNQISNFAKQEGIISRGKNAVLKDIKGFNDMSENSLKSVAFITKIASMMA